MRLTLLRSTSAELAPGGSVTVEGLAGYSYALLMGYTQVGLRSSVIVPTTSANAAFATDGPAQGVSVSGSTLTALRSNTQTVFLTRVYGAALPS